MKSSSTCIAYPGLPIVFAEGFRDYSQRLSAHNSIGCALSDIKKEVRTETSVEISGKKTRFLLDDKPLSGVRGKNMLHMVELVKKHANYTGGLRITSKNYGIQTGSSDSGAAAAITALNDFFELNIPPHKLLNIGRIASETVFRSLYGGLSEYIVEGVRQPIARKLAEAKELENIMVYAINFEGERFKADELHLKVVEHPRYPLRRAQVKERMDSLKEFLREKDFTGIFSVVESESRTFHEMMEDLKKPVRSSDMIALCQKIRLWRSEGTMVYWNIAGGRTIYLFTLSNAQHEVAKKLSDEGLSYVKYKIAEGAKII